MARSWIIAGAAATAVFAASATPAHAITISHFNDTRSIEVTVSDCATNAVIGSTCRGFVVEALLAKNETGIVARSIGVQGLELTVTGPGGAASGVKVSEGATSVGTITIPTSARNGKLKVSLVLTCDTEPCAVSGAFTISVSARKGAGSSYTVASGSNRTEFPPSCSIESGGLSASQQQPAATGTVKSGSVTKALRVLPGSDGEVTRSYSFSKQKGFCV